MVGERIELGWPSTSRVFLTIDYECDYGTALAENSYQALSRTEQLVSILEELGIPLTCFVQTEALTEKPEEVEKLRHAATTVSFHPHSHTHKPRDETDVTAEVARSTEAYEEYFGTTPAGYRFPNGNIRPDDYGALAANDYEWDASVFPSWRPGHFDNRDAPLDPVYQPAHDLFEIPFTVYSNRVRIPTALSYCRLVGRPFTELLVRRPPEVVIFNIHMHDLVNPPAFERLSPMYRAIYSRNAEGMALLKQVLERFRDAGYTFGQLDDIAGALTDERPA